MSSLGLTLRWRLYSAVKKLLHIAVSDVSNDVRRNAVTALGFVMCNEPQQVPRIVSLLSESYNTHVRYGACLAVGIACAGSGMKVRFYYCVVSLQLEEQK